MGPDEGVTADVPVGQTAGRHAGQDAGRVAPEPEPEPDPDPIPSADRCRSTPSVATETTDRTREDQEKPMDTRTPRDHAAERLAARTAKYHAEVERLRQLAGLTTPADQPREGANQ